MEKKEIKNIVTIIIISLITYILAYLFLRLYAYPNKPFEIDITIISSLPTLLVVVATLTYVVITQKMLLESRFERKKSFIREIIKEILFPLYDSVERQLHEFKTKSCFSTKSQEFSLDKFYLVNFIFCDHAELFYKIFEKNYPKLALQIRLHDQLLSEINDLVNNIIQPIITDEFKNKWLKEIDLYERTSSPEEETFPEDYGANKETYRIDRILTCILQNKRCHDVPKLFWKIHQKEILSEGNKYKDEFNKLKAKSNKIINLLDDLKKNIENTIISEQENYGILEITPLMIR